MNLYMKTTIETSKMWSIYTVWSLYTGSIAWNVYLWGPVKCGVYKQGVLYTGGFRAGLTAYERIVFFS